MHQNFIKEIKRIRYCYAEAPSIDTPAGTGETPVIADPPAPPPPPDPTDPQLGEAGQRAFEYTKQENKQLRAALNSLTDGLQSRGISIPPDWKRDLDSFDLDRRLQAQQDNAVRQAREATAAQYETQLLKQKESSQALQKMIDDRAVLDYFSKAVNNQQVQGLPGYQEHLLQMLQAQEGLEFQYERDENGAIVREGNQPKITGYTVRGKRVIAEEGKDLAIVGNDGINQPLPLEGFLYRYRSNANNPLSGFFAPLSSSSGANTPIVQGGQNGGAAVFSGSNAYDEAYQWHRKNYPNESFADGSRKNRYSIQQ